MYFLSQLSGIYLNDVRANIKIKKEKKNKLAVKSVALLGHRAPEVGERGGEKGKRKVTHRK